MKPLAVIPALFLVSGNAAADLIVVDAEGESVIYDRQNDLYWYRNLPNMLGVGSRGALVLLLGTYSPKLVH